MKIGYVHILLTTKKASIFGCNLCTQTNFSVLDVYKYYLGVGARSADSGRVLTRGGPLCSARRSLHGQISEKCTLLFLYGRCAWDYD